MNKKLKNLTTQAVLDNIFWIGILIALLPAALFGADQNNNLTGLTPIHVSISAFFGLSIMGLSGAYKPRKIK